MADGAANESKEETKGFVIDKPAMANINALADLVRNATTNSMETETVEELSDGTICSSELCSSDSDSDEPADPVQQDIVKEVKEMGKALDQLIEYQIDSSKP